MNYQVKIVLESDMCMGNGEGRGNAIDLDICTDRNGVPYIPARRIKGCLRETADFLMQNGFSVATEENIVKLFGDCFGNEGLLIINDAQTSEAQSVDAAIKCIQKKGKPYLKRAIHSENITKNYCAVRGQTKLKNGMKVDGSLRFTRVLKQYNLLFNENEPMKYVSVASILEDNNSELMQLLDACCKGTRHIGTKRNRGLGNVSISLEPRKEEGYSVTAGKAIDDKLYCISYKIQLDSPVTIPDFAGTSTIIPARSVIGCLAGYFSKSNIDKAKFEKLFLDGTVRWSPLTPVIEGKVSKPVPSLIMKLKNGNGRLINRFSEENDNWKRLKPKTVDGSFAVISDEGFSIADVHSRAQYHNSMSGEMLYTQESIDSGYIYGGTVTFSGKYYSDIVELLLKSNLRFGRSKNVQYSNCHLCSISEPVEVKDESRTVSGKVYVVLESDMIVMENGIYLADYSSVRDYIAGLVGLKISEETTEGDSVRFGLVGGFQNMWHLQKMQIPTIKAGSIFCYSAEQCDVPLAAQLGEAAQEGFGQIRVYTDAEMRAMGNVQYRSCDVVITEAKEDEIARVETALTQMVVRETLLSYARSYKSKEEEPIPVSRLRLMLQTAATYNDFMDKVNTIKESDVSSAKKGRKMTSIDFLKDFFGGEEICWSKLLAGENGLYEAISDEVGCVKWLEEMWKLPLMTFLHNAHYDK